MKTFPVRVVGVMSALSLPIAAHAAANLMNIPYRPFIDPVEMHGWWWALIVPMALGVSLAYKAVRLPTMQHFARQALLMTIQIIVAMAVLAAASYGLVMVYVKWIAEHAG